MTNMKLAIPVEDYQALNSVVYGHFGSAPLFVLVDTDTLGIEPLQNDDQHHAHGACNPVRVLAGRTVDAVAVGGIGAGAINGLRQAGIKVYHSSAQTVAEIVAQFNAGQLPEIELQQACGGHQAGNTCHH
jgi:predicted Fe-Mo cluster-binding NifX family protein